MPASAPSIAAVAPGARTHRLATGQCSSMDAAEPGTGCPAVRPPRGTDPLARQGDLMAMITITRLLVP